MYCLVIDDVLYFFMSIEHLCIFNVYYQFMSSAPCSRCCRYLPFVWRCTILMSASQLPASLSLKIFSKASAFSHSKTQAPWNEHSIGAALQQWLAGVGDKNPSSFTLAFTSLRPGFYTISPSFPVDQTVTTCSGSRYDKTPFIRGI